MCVIVLCVCCRMFVNVSLNCVSVYLKAIYLCIHNCRMEDEGNSSGKHDRILDLAGAHAGKVLNTMQRVRE